MDFLRRAVLPVSVSGPHGRARVEAIIDTGFSASFSITLQLIHQLGLRPYGSAMVQDAGGSIALVSTYLVDLDWLGASLKCEALENNIPHCLLGTGLLDGHVLEIDFGPAKRVEIR